MSTNDDLEYNPCGGCGADRPSQRCIGCSHQFGKGRKRKASKTPPDAEPAPQCPTCNGHRIVPRSDSYQTGEGNLCPTCVEAEWRDFASAPRDGSYVRLKMHEGHIHEMRWSDHYSIHGLGGCWTIGGPVTMSDFDFIGWQPIDWEAWAKRLIKAVEKAMPILEEHCGDVFLESIKAALKS